MDFEEIFFGKFLAFAGVFDNFREQDKLFSEAGKVIGFGTARPAFEFLGFILNFFNGVENVGRFGINSECGNSVQDFSNFFELAVLLKGNKALIKHIKFFGTCRRLHLFHREKFLLCA